MNPHAYQISDDMIAKHFIIFISWILLLVNGFPAGTEENNEEYYPAIDISYLGSSIFKQPDPEVGKRLENWNETSLENPEEYGEYADGDILFPNKGRNGLAGEAFRWKNGEVPYEISGSFTSNDKQIIKRAMEIYKKYTCVRYFFLFTTI